MHNPSYNHGKLSPRVTKMAFIRSPMHSNGYEMYSEHPSGDITEIDSRNVDFPKDKFSSISEIKKYLELYKLQ